MKQYQKKQALETAIGGVFLLLGLVSVGCVLLICTYLVISGIPAIRKIGLVPFLFGKVWASTAKTNPQYGILPFILTSVYGMQVQSSSACQSAFLPRCIWQSLPRRASKRCFPPR